LRLVSPTSGASIARCPWAFATYLTTTTDLTDAEIASIRGWSEAEVERLRRIYVDDTVQIALGKRIAPWPYRGLTAWVAFRPPLSNAGIGIRVDGRMMLMALAGVAAVNREQVAAFSTPSR